jgi:hypothetical protein
MVAATYVNVTPSPAAAAEDDTEAPPQERVEVAELTDETTQVFAEPDGTHTAEFNVLPVRVQRGDDWVPVDTTLVANSKGVITPEAVPASLEISGGGDAPLVELESDGRSIALSWPEELPKPELEGDTATYADVWPGVDLRVTATVLGYTTALVVKEPDAVGYVEEFTLGFTTKGVSMDTDEAGRAVATDTDGELVFHSREATMWDAATLVEADGDAEAMAFGFGAESQVADVDVEVTADTLTVQPDAELLKSSDAEFPLVIEPHGDNTIRPNRTGYARIKSGKPGSRYWNDGTLAKTGNCGTWPDCNGIGKVRSLFQYDIRSLRGATIIRADFNIVTRNYASCKRRGLGLWDFNTIDRNLTWNNHSSPPYGWRRDIAIAGPTNKGRTGTGCTDGGPGSAIGFNVTDAVRRAVGEPKNTVTLMLKNGTVETQGDYESDRDFWGRYENNPTLEVNFNNAPNRPTNLSANRKECRPGIGNAVYITSGDGAGQPARPTLRAELGDPDDDQVRAHFQWDLSDGNGNHAGEAVTVTTAYRRSGLGHDAIVTGDRFTHGTYVAYRVRADDGKQGGLSPWTSWCYVGVDNEPPDRPPKVSSPHYLECEDPTSCEISGSPGQSGLFTFDANGVDDVVGFYWGLNAEPTNYVAAGPERDGTQSASAIITPPPNETGGMSLHVASVDHAGNIARPENQRNYRFYIGDRAGAVGHWELDGRGDDDIAADVSGHGHPGVVNGLESGKVEWIDGRTGDALRFDGSGGYVQTAATSDEERIVHTDAAFTVSAWVRIPSGVDGGWRTVVSQSSDRSGGFFVQYNGSSGELSFAMPHPDEAAVDRASAPLPATDVWTHVAAAYNPANPANVGMELYINGRRAATADRPADRRWHAPGPLQIGRGKWNGTWGQAWIGDVDEIRIFSRALSREEIVGNPHNDSRRGDPMLGISARPTSRAGSYLLNDGGTDAFELIGLPNPATLGPGASWGPGHLGRGTALSLTGGVDSFAATEDPLVRTDQSFTVSAWVKADRLDHSHRIAVSQDGDSHSGFMLGYDNLHCQNGEPDPGCEPGKGKWAFTLPLTGDGPMRDVTVVHNARTPQLGQWVHLTGVFNAPARELRVFVNGNIQGQEPRTLTVDEMSRRWNATGGLQIGRAKRDGEHTFPFAGQVACVEVHTGVRTFSEIQAAHRHGCPDVPADSANTGQLGRWVSHGDRDMLTNGRFTGPSGYYFAEPLGFTAPEDTDEETVMLYGCAAGQRAGDAFTSGDPNCEGQRKVGPIGLAYADEPEGVPSVALYRCVVNQSGHPARDQHFDSNDPNCEGIGRQEGRLGYLASYAYLMRYASPGAHWTSSRGVPVRFEREGWLGVVSLRPEQGTARIFACRTPNGTMTSRDSTCEGSGALGQPIGYVWNEPPPNMQSRRLYRCKVGENHFDSLDENCEGQQVEGELGYVVTEF